MSNSLKIGILAPPWQIPPPAYGGVETAIDGLCTALEARGHDVFLFSHPDSTCLVERGSATIAERQEDGWHTAPTEVRYCLSGYDWLISKQVDIIHDHTFAGPFIGLEIASVPVVSTNWLPFYPPMPGQTFPDLSLIYERMGNLLPVLGLSAGQAQRAPGAVAEVIHLGTDLNVRPGDGRGDGDGEYVAFLGRMAPEKGLTYAIELAAKFEVPLKIAARMDEPQEREYFVAAVEPLLKQGRATYVGELGPMEKTELLRGASVLLNPMTWQEPFGLVMIEAMAVGTPVIASSGGSVEEIITPGLTGAICQTRLDFERAMIGRHLFDRSACRRDVESRFSYDLMAERHEQFYRRVLVAGS